MTTRHCSAAAVILAIVAYATAPAHTAGAIILDSVTVRVYDTVGVTPSDRDTALKTAGAILGRADVEAVWVVCPARDGRTPWTCNTPPAARELVVRLTNSTPLTDAAGQRSFGYSVLDPSTSTGVLSTVFIDRVDWLASTGRAARGQVLGRAIAHELGHLMLGSNDHTAKGLMRETWTPEEITSNRAEDWQFSSSQRATMHARLVGSDPAGRRARARDSHVGGPGGD